MALLPNTITEIGDEMFCRTGLAWMIVPYTVRSIGNSAFEYCSLTRLDLPAAVGSLGDRILYGSTNLEDIICRAYEPPTCTDLTFDGFDRTKCTLHVPSGSKAKYREAAHWKEFSDIVEDELPQFISSIELECTSEMTLGEESHVGWSLFPEGIDAGVLFEISDRSVIEMINADGGPWVKAVGVGHAVIRATVTWGGASQEVEITVTYPAQIETVDTESTTVRVIGGEIVAEDVPAGTLVRVFTIDGNEVDRAVSTGDTLIFTPRRHGIYLIVTGSHCSKAIL